MEIERKHVALVNIMNGDAAHTERGACGFLTQSSAASGWTDSEKMQKAPSTRQALNHDDFHDSRAGRLATIR